MFKTERDLQRLQAVVFEHAEELEGVSADSVVRWARDTFGTKLCATSSMSDAAITHLASSCAPGLDVLFLDTGYHFAETLAFRDQVAAAFDVRVVDLRSKPAPGNQIPPWSTDSNDCCRLRKVVPLRKALAGYDAWLTGIRRAESPSRSQTPVVSWDSHNQVVKVAPLAAWTDEALAAYLHEHALPGNRLTELGYPSIGCEPCTSLPVGADARSGRWPGQHKTECGLHAS
jgi:phosphoadenosine phosphosulfate reductase